MSHPTRALIAICLLVPSAAFAKLPPEIEALNHCRTESDCMGTRMSDLTCKTACGRMGILIHRGEKAAFVKLSKAAGGNPRLCPQVDCKAPPPSPSECRYKCVESKCRLDFERSSKKC